MYARLFALIARRPEFRSHDPADRIDHAWTNEGPGAVPLIDRVLIAGATGLDQVCGYAVARLSTRVDSVLLDVLGVLPAERLCAMYHALPGDTRHRVLRDGVWAVQVGQIDAGDVRRAAAFWSDLPVELAISDVIPYAEQHGYFDAVRDALRATAGLPPQDTTDEES